MNLNYLIYDGNENKYINVHEMYAFKCKILVEIIFCEKKKSVEWYKTWN